MNNAAALAIALAVVTLGVVSWRAADARVAPQLGPVDDGDTGALFGVDWSQVWGPGPDSVDVEQALQIIADPEANVAAMLDVIARCEGTARKPDPYRVCYAERHVIQSLAQHPAVSGEWGGELLTDEQCRGAGLGPGCKSTAAGKYQITRPTWLRAAGALGLVDFGPASQDAAAVWLIGQCGALPALRAGDLATAVDRMRRTWASLPGANYAGQGMRSYSQVSTWFLQSGGVITA